MQSPVRRYLVPVLLPSVLSSCLMVAGCGGGTQGKLTFVEGTVSHNGMPVQLGVVRFVALSREPTQASVAPKLAVIEDGKYRVDAGLPDGQFRVEVEVLRKTDEKVAGLPGEKKTDKIIRTSPDLFAGDQSPLRFDTARDKSPFAIQISDQR